LFEETTPHRWLERLKPNIHTNGAEYGQDCIERDLVESQGGKIHLLPMVDGYKTSLMIDKIKRTPA
jgi:bifunctional ADP-heptose synthase (sugar kinase/adenylyltransferase)